MTFFHLKKDPLYQDILEGEMASQPTLSRFENSLDKSSIFRLCYAWMDQYNASLKGRKRVVIDINATDDPTHVAQQMSMFSGFYRQFMYNELFFHNAYTGQIIVPILIPGNSHSNKWYVSIFKRVVGAIRARYPKIEIVVRADTGVSCAPFCKLATAYQLLFVVGIARNEVLKKELHKPNVL